MGLEAIEAFLASVDAPSERLGDGHWGVQLRGERKLTIPVSITVTGDRVRFESFFMRKPQENQDRFYELLLRRNARAYGVAFALDAIGDVYLVGYRALDAVDEDELDRVFGSILTEADGMFDAAIAVGFASYLAADQAWRAAQA